MLKKEELRRPQCPDSKMDLLRRVFLCLILLARLADAAAAANERAPVMKEHPSSVVARRNDPATLNCAAQGADSIRWYRDGREVTTSPGDPRSHRVQLLSGSLFFLRVTTGKKDSDAGTYWCVASNGHGATRSRNATLTVATLGYEFQSQAGPSVRVRVGGPLVLPCRAPKGTPAPEVTWLRDGLQVTNSTRRVTVTEAGDLVFTRTVEGDSAIYVCRARNAAGVRETPQTHLIVMTPPWFEERPANVTAASGVRVELACRARGSPTPTFTWRRLEGKMPLGRVTIEEERLVLEGVVAGDSGVYVCEVENEAGVGAARATLTVVDAPQLTQKPQDLRVMAGDAARVECGVDGVPPPLMMWRLPTADRRGLLPPGRNNGRASVSRDGRTLLLQETTTQDSGTYSCWGVSSGGGVIGRAEVLVVSGHPPPLVGVGPRDLTVALGGVASFPCEAVSEGAQARVAWWFRPTAKGTTTPRQLNQESPRVSLPANGALILKNVRTEDAGIYTCRVTASSGTVTQEAELLVSSEARRPGAPPLLPAPPSKPRLVAVNATAVHLSWLPNSQESGGEANQWYRVEYWREGWGAWRLARERAPGEWCVLSHLSPGFTYTFLVRAVSRNGASFPSPWSDPITTGAGPGDAILLTQEELRHARRRLSRPVVSLTNADVTAPDSVQLVWDFLVPTEEWVEGVLVYAVQVEEEEEWEGSVQVATVLGASTSSHLLQHLRPSTHYAFFVVPFWRGVEGAPSNSRLLTTPDDVPSAAPGEVQVKQREDGTVIILWSSLDPAEARGRLLGYRVTLHHNGTRTTHTVQTPWLEAPHLVSGRLYTVRVAALTSAGAGPSSDPVLIDVGDKSGPRDDAGGDAEGGGGGSLLYSPPQPAWLVYLLIPVVFLLFLATMVYVRRLRQKPQAPSSSTPARDPSLLYQDPSQHSVSMYGEQQKLWRPAESDKDSSLSSTRLLPSEMSANEYAEPRLQRAEPYATTALLKEEEGRDAGGRGPLRHDARWPHHSDDSGVQVNWVAFLPPPPSCPPPMDPIDPAHRSLPPSDQYERPCDSDTQLTYDVYTQVTPHDGLLTFSTLQTRGSSSSRRSRTHSPAPVPPPTDPHRSNTH